MSSAELRRLKEIQKEIEIIKGEINMITAEYTSDKVTGSMPNHPYIFTSFNISGYDMARYSNKQHKLEKLLHRKLDELMDERKKIEEYIDRVEDSTTRMILRLRHINGFKWEQIGRELGYSTRHVIRLYDAHVKTME